MGLPLGRSPLVSRLAKRLDKWKNAFLSKGGRLTLIQSVLSALPIYYMSLFRIPVAIAVMIETFMRYFFWEGLSEDNATPLVA